MIETAVFVVCVSLEGVEPIPSWSRYPALTLYEKRNERRGWVMSPYTYKVSSVTRTIYLSPDLCLFVSLSGSGTDECSRWGTWGAPHTSPRASCVIPRMPTLQHYCLECPTVSLLIPHWKKVLEVSKYLLMDDHLDRILMQHPHFIYILYFTSRPKICKKNKIQLPATFAYSVLHHIPARMLVVSHTMM